MLRPFSLAALALAAGLSACNTAQEASAPSPSPGAYANLPPGVSPPGFHLPQGSGCSGEVARWKALQDNDLASGHVSQSVFNQIQGDISRASAACSAGRDAEAVSIVRASRARHGYPA
jgi:hypothetical protein